MTGDDVVARPSARTAERVDFLISYTGADRPWATWAGVQLEAAGYTVELDAWDWKAGSNVVLTMDAALGRARRVLALWSPAYFDPTRFTTDEWTAVLAERPDQSGEHRLVPIRVADVTPPKILGPVLYRDVFGLPEDEARKVLLEAVGGPVERTGNGFPGSPAIPTVSAPVGPRVPGSLPEVWNVPARLAGFTGRQAQLASLREQLLASGRSEVCAMNGLGGVGKTQLAIEYAYMFSGEYDLVWWIDAEQADLIGEQIVDLAATAGWDDADAGVAQVWPKVKDRLRRETRWLLIFDNVELPESVAPWLPTGSGGQVILTSRHRAFTGVAAPMEIEEFTRAESVAYLTQFVPRVVGADADELSDALGDLPLALAQAAGLLAETGMSAAEYLQELRDHASELLLERKVFGYPRSLGAAIALSLERLETVDPVAVEVMNLCSALAPEPIPIAWFRAVANAESLREDVAAVLGRPLALRRTLARLESLGLARVDEESVQVHRLTQTVVRDRRSSSEAQSDRELAVMLVSASEPEDDGGDPRSWPAWALLLPHVLFLRPADAPTAIRDLACNALWYLLRRGEDANAVVLAEDWHMAWQATNGPDNHHVLWVANQRAAAYKTLGRFQEAYDLDRDAYERRRRIFGEERPNTLFSAGNLAADLRGLGRDQEAFDLDGDTYDRLRRVLGEDHPATLRSANNFAAGLRGLGRDQEALDLDRDTYERRRRVLGEDHPDTLSSANNFALDLSQSGHHQAALDLNQATYERRQRVLGKDHPNTRTSAKSLASDLRQLGRTEEADQIDPDHS